KAGLAEFTADLLDEGAGELDSTAYQSKLEDLAASLDFNVDQDNISARLRTLSANLAPTYDLLHLALTEPRFDAAPVARLRAELLDAIKRDLHQPEALAYRLWMKSSFAGSPYARSTRGTAQSIAAITPDDMRGLVHARFAKDALVIGVVGDITPAALKPLLDKTFGGLPEHAAPDPLGNIAVDRSNSVIVSDLPVPQSVVVFGQQGIKRDDPDWYAGLILGHVASRNARVAQAIDLIREEWRRMHDSGPTAKELVAAKTYLTGSFPLNLDSTSRIASILVSMQLDHLGIDYLTRRSALIDKVSLADAKRVARRLLDPDGLFFVVVGSPANLSDARRVAPGG